MKKFIVFTFVLIAILGMTTSVSAEGHLPIGEITKPAEGEILWGMLSLEATYTDDDPLGVQWAVREGTCARGTNTVAGNVDGFSTAYSFDGSLFTAMIETSGFTPGMYCFIFNPRENSGEPDMRLTREFILDPQEVYAGGQIIEDMGGKTADNLKISFGGYVNELYNGDIVGEWQINFHNVAADGLDKSKFHTTDIRVLNLYSGDSPTCNDAMNFTAFGRWNGMAGYKLIFRAGDLGSPGKADTIRVELWRPDKVKVYDTYWTTEFTAESSCVGTARTGLDAGNLTIAP